MNIEKRVALLENRSHVNFAAISNKAMGLESGNVKIELSPAHGAIYFATNRKPLSECIHFDVYESDIKDVNSITFKDGREITGVVDSYTEDPTKVLSAVAIDEFVTQVDELEDKVKDHETRITTNTNKIAEHDVSIMKNESNIRRNERNIEVNRDAINDCTDALSDNYRRVSAIEENVTANTTNIADHEKRITNNTTTLADHEKRINQNAADIIDCITDIGNNRNRIDGVINKTEDHETRITQNTNKITNLENTKAEKTEVLTYDDIFRRNSLLLATHPFYGNWEEICAFGVWKGYNNKYIFSVVKTLASMEVSIYFKVPENKTYWLHFNKLSRKCDDPKIHMFDFRFERVEDTVMYGNMNETPRIWSGSWSVNSNQQYIHTYFNVDLNYGSTSKPKVTLRFRFLRNQLYDFDKLSGYTFKDYINIDGETYITSLKNESTISGYNRLRDS